MLKPHTSLKRRFILTLMGFGTLALAAIVLAPLAGSTTISLTNAFDRSQPFAANVDAQILFVARLPRVLADIREFAEEDPLFWRPSPLLVDLVERGKDFDSLNKAV